MKLLHSGVAGAGGPVFFFFFFSLKRAGELHIIILREGKVQNGPNYNAQRAENKN
jgi:hypothetical protein